MNLPAKPEAVAHVSDAHWEAALIEAVARSDRSVEKPATRLLRLAKTGKDGAADYARCLILLGEVLEPVDPISDAIDALYNDWMMTPYNSKNERSDLVTLCRKHFAGLTFPETSRGVS